MRHVGDEVCLYMRKTLRAIVMPAELKMDILTFIVENPWQTFFLGPFVFVLGVLAAWIMGGVLNFTFLIINRVLRTIKVCARGWPPEHIDADGDEVCGNCENEKKKHN